MSIRDFTLKVMGNDVRARVDYNDTIQWHWKNTIPMDTVKQISQDMFNSISEAVNKEYQRLKEAEAAERETRRKAEEAERENRKAEFLSKVKTAVNDISFLTSSTYPGTAYLSKNDISVTLHHDSGQRRPWRFEEPDGTKHSYSTLEKLAEEAKASVERAIKRKIKLAEEKAVETKRANEIIASLSALGFNTQSETQYYKYDKYIRL